MKKRTIVLLILICSLSMVGIVFIQVYWVKNAVQLQAEQFDNKVQLILKSVVNRMFDERDIALSDTTRCKNLHCDHRTLQVLTSINTLRLDSLLNEEFGSMKISKSYKWGVFNADCETIFAGNSADFTPQLIATNHRVSLSCLYQPEELLLGVYFPEEKNVFWLKILPWLLLSFILLGVVIYAFSFVLFSLLRQKKLSEMKTDFVNNMTHEFKTPIATISLASEMLLKSEIAESPLKANKYARIIHQENLRLQQQVDQVLQISILDKGGFSLKRVEFNAHDTIKSCIKHFEITVREKGGFISGKLNAEKQVLYNDTHHFANMINNLLDNAAKYSPAYPEIQVITKNIDGMFVVEVHDKGIGIGNEDQKQIFRKLYRVHTGNVHDVKGFGLGLFYVKTMAEAMGGSVHVRSELTKGSVFEIRLPLNAEKS
ncbi:MAG: HAMP domain-containing sensor histidine kinase [Lentimicrobium sp.]|jgi:two-component system phosphate regulon sensor histidine kinase PhoR|nr:HAMP domain-containing sensor histidine kinase [Lentimicrobium sp.]